MTRILLQSWKDVRALRLLLLGWVAVLVLQAVLSAYPFDIRYPILSGTPLGLAHLALDVAHLALLVALSVLLVHADAATGTTAFWLTRPIARPAMLASKLLTALVVLVLAPTLADAAAVAASRLPPADVALAAAFTGLQHLVVVLPAMAVAALTLDLAGFAAASLGIGTAFVMWVMTLGIALSSSRVRWRPRGAEESWAILAALGLTAAAGLAVLSLQYLARSRRASAALLVACTLALPLPLRFAPFRAERPMKADALGAGPVSLTIHRFWDRPLYQFAGSAPPRAGARTATGRVEVAATIDATAPEGNVALTAIAVDGRLQIGGDGGGPVSEDGSVRRVWSVPAPWSLPETRRAVAHAIRPVEPWWERVSGDDPIRLVLLDEAQRTRVLQQGARYTADVRLRGTRFEALAPVPLARGSEGAAGNRRFAILDAEWETRGCTVTLREVGADLRPDVRPLSAVAYLLVHRRLGGALFGRSYGQYAEGRMPYWLPTAEHVAIRYTSLRFDTPSPDGIPITPDWLKDAALVPLVARDLGIVRRPLVIPDFGERLRTLVGLRKREAAR